MAVRANVAIASREKGIHVAKDRPRARRYVHLLSDSSSCTYLCRFEAKFSSASSSQRTGRPLRGFVPTVVSEQEMQDSREERGEKKTHEPMKNAHELQNVEKAVPQCLSPRARSAVAPIKDSESGRGTYWR